MSRLLDKMTIDYLEDVLVCLAHHSSAIDGNTITLPETVTIIVNDALPNNAKITRSEFYEVDNHQQAFEYVIHSIRNDEKLSVPIIKNIHEKLTDRLQYDKGQFKSKENYIKGAEFSTAPPEQVPQLMDQLIGNLNDRLETAATEEDLLRAILQTHIQFEKILPFSNGNGRTGRMVINYSLLQHDLPPLIIRKQDKNEYMQILAEAQMKEIPDEEDIERFVAFTNPIMKEERRRMLSFSNKASKQI
ncbi:Fic family protein [Sporosarcina sp. ACRSM]|uniref:Fic family protein n=1 Tax=Sporosarcina sp. ACRSM TaxID=2918216 RepID=UPI001EF74D64|nr:Fic family protein [Sporosarcina sp. ACRSM]MCG7337178.1 Fic family protein [Sporosarcina sp. ACRSM]